MYYELKQSSPENLVAAPVGSIFTRLGEKFFLTSNGERTRINLPKKSFAVQYQDEVLLSSLTEDGITFKTNGETWRKVSGTGKKGWKQISTNKSTNATSISPIEQIIEDIQSAMAGYGFSYFLKTNGELYSSGTNSDGQLGLGLNGGVSTASLCLTDVKKMVNGVYSYHGLALKNDNTLWGTGYGSDGQFGDGLNTDYNVWTQIDLQGDITGSGTIVDFGCSEYYSAYLMSDNTLWVSGNEFNIVSNIPVLISNDVKTFAAGGYHLLYVKNDGTLFGIGNNGYGQLGTGDNNYHPYDDPAQIDTNVKVVGADGYHGGYIKNDNTLWMMGANYSGQLGVGDTTDRNTPVQVDTDVKFVTGGNGHTVYIKNDNTLWGMGDNTDGELGTGDFYGNYDTYYQTVPIFIASDVSSASAGDSHTLYVKTNKTCYGMGYNSQYELGSRIYNSVIYSSDGINWTREGVTKLPFYGFRDGTYGGGKFIAVGTDSDGGTTPIIKYSTDGKVWNDAALNETTNNYFTSVAYNGTDKYVAVSRYASEPNLYISSDGINWTSVYGTQNFLKVSYANDKFIAAEYGVGAYYSYDGETWLECTVPHGFTGKVAYANSTYVMTPSGVGYNILYSSDGITWSDSSYTVNYYTDYNNIVYGNGKFVTFGGTDTILTSTDGITWNNYPITGSNEPTPQALMFDGSHFIAAVYTEEKYDVYTSTDGESWTPHRSGMSYVNYTAAAYGDGKYILLNRDAGDYVATQEKITL